MYEITIKVDVHDANYEALPTDDTNPDFESVEHQTWEGEITVNLPFVPHDGLHLGEHQFLSVCQVHWRGGNQFDVYTRTITCADYNVSALFHNRRYGPDDLKVVRRWFTLEEAIAKVEAAIDWGATWKWTKPENES